MRHCHFRRGPIYQALACKNVHVKAYYSSYNPTYMESA